jgi:hypothetical protein
MRMLLSSSGRVMRAGSPSRNEADAKEFRPEAMSGSGPYGSGAISRGMADVLADDEQQ